jgi:hypothetical protein
MAQSQSGAHVAPKEPAPQRPAAGNGGVFLFSLLLAIVLGGFFCFPAEVLRTDASGATHTEFVFKWSSLFGAGALPVGSVVFLILCAVSALVLLVFGLFIRNALRGALYVILGLAGVGVMVYMCLDNHKVWMPDGNMAAVSSFRPEWVTHILGSTQELPANIQLLFVMGVGLLLAVMTGAARARVLFPANGSSKAWSVITALGLLAIFAAPAVVTKTYAKWTNPLADLSWATSGKALMDFAVLSVAAILGLLAVLTSLFGVGGGRSSRGRGIFVMCAGMTVCILLPVYLYIARPEMLSEPLGASAAAWSWLLKQKQLLLGGASAWSFFAMIGLGLSDLICQGQVRKLAPASPQAVHVTPAAAPAARYGAPAAPASQQQQRLEEISKLYNAGLLSEEEYQRRRNEILGR